MGCIYIYNIFCTIYFLHISYGAYDILLSKTLYVTVKIFYMETPLSYIKYYTHIYKKNIKILI